jgi:hypothetical protein
MSRRYGRKLIRSFTIRNYGKIDVYYYPNEGEFQTKVFDVDLAAATERELEKLARETVDQRQALDWQPAIKVTHYYPGEDDSWGRGRDDRIDLEFDRLYVAVQPDGKPVQHRWHCHETDDEVEDCDQPKTDFFDERNAQRRPWTGETFYWHEERLGAFVVPCQNGNTYYIPYAVETWRGLEAVRTALLALRDRLHQLVTTDEGLVQLKKARFNLLEAPKGKEKA